MKIHEYQGKAVLAEFGVPVPKGRVIDQAADAADVFAELGGGLCVVKAQIHAGGRGKGGGVKLARTAAEAVEYANDILGMQLVTHQTGPEGTKVMKVLVEEGTDIARELYVAMVPDRETQRVCLMASTEGGMDIEKVAAETPEKILKEWVDPAVGLCAYQCRKVAFALGIEGKAVRAMTKVLIGLYDAFMAKDGSLAEINPLVVTGDGEIIALDAKFNFDSNALYRQKGIVAMRDFGEEDEREIEASKHDLAYIALDGNIGCLVNGAGLAMATMDTIKLFGGEPANFLDVGGGATTAKVTAAFKLILADDAVRCVMVNIFGGIMKCDVIAEGVVAAAKEVGLSIPLVVRLAGTNVDLGKKILAESGLPIISAGNMGDAARKAVEAAGKA
ncbi:MAG: ADP-forming succinate--CoA ligase subunit beta [Myxococcota bacterium]|jgi:succinyl-CoA synthetase beta subunit|nr:ADP-forming succinate--CoA ligase subunit beta [Myxococcota bacterium]